jgi:hypothetical protein
MSQQSIPRRAWRWTAAAALAATLLGTLALTIDRSSAKGAQTARFKVIGVAGTLSAQVTAGYGAFQCPGKTPSLFSGNIHGRRPGKPVGQQTQYGTIYNNLFKASVQSGGGRFNPGTGKGALSAKVKMPFVTGGTGEKVGCHPYTICQDHNDTSVMEMSIFLRKVGRKGARMFWSPGGETTMPRDDLPPLNAAGLVPIYNCLDTYYPFVLTAPRGRAPCTNKAPKPGTLAKDVFVLHLKCAYNRPEFHPYTDGDGTRNVSDRASIEADVKVKRIN